MQSPLAVGIGATGQRWLVAFALAVVVVLAAGWVLRGVARRAALRPGGEAGVRGTRRRAGALIALGPLVGLVVAPAGVDRVVAVAVGGAVALAVFGAVVERRRGFAWPMVGVVGVASAAAVVAGVRFSPTGVGVLDVVLGFAFVAGGTLAFNGLGNTDALVPVLGSLSSAGVLALAAFAGQHGVADVAAGLLGASVAFLAYNVAPASLFAGRAGRLATGFTLSVLALATTVAPGPPAPLAVPVMLLAVPLLDLVVVCYDRAERRRSIVADRRDHLVHRMMAYGASPVEAAAVLALVQGMLVALAVLSGRGVLPLWAAVAIGGLIVGTLGGYALRAPLDRLEPIGFSPRARWVTGTLLAVVALGVVPLVLDAPDITETMQRGRVAAQRGLAAARNGDTGRAEIEFRRAATEFEAASDRIGSVKYQAARIVPGIAPNLRATRALAGIGADLARNGEVVTAAVVPEALSVDDGRVPVEEVKRVTPALERGADTLERSLRRLRAVEKEPYLLAPVRDAIRTVRRQLRQGAREARNTADAARLAPAILGAGGTDRRYLLVVQNPAENRGTGGLIGSYGILTVSDGQLSISPLLRTGTWNGVLQAEGAPTFDAPDDYVKRYGQFQPGTHLQNVNLSPDFPTVGRVLASLAPQAGMGPVDGVIAVDPEGLAALLELTGPVFVPGWPTEVSADNVVDVTLRDAYAAFATTPERADFLGDVAHAVVDEATAGTLGEPAKVAQVLGEAAHQGHLVTWFSRPEEQALAESIGMAGELARGGDVLHVTDANFGANKLDYYLRRDLDYRVEVRPDDTGRGAGAAATVTVRLENTAPADGLPQIVAGPYEGAPPGRVKEGENIAYVSVYSPLALRQATIDGSEVPVVSGDELGVRVYSTVVRVLAQQQRSLEMDLAGRIRMAPGGWYVLHLGSQPMVNPGRARVSIGIPDGYRIVAAPGLQIVSGVRATGTIDLDRSATVRVRIVRAPGSFWRRLQAGS